MTQIQTRNKPKNKTRYNLNRVPANEMDQYLTHFNQHQKHKSSVFLFLFIYFIGKKKKRIVESGI